MGISLLDPSGPSGAIAAMLKTLTAPPPQVGATPGAPAPGGGPMPGLLSSNLPAMNAPAPTAPPSSMIDRIHQRLSGILDSVRPDAPAGYEGLLTPDEIKSARPGRLQSLIGSPDAPSSSDRYRSNLDNIVKMHGLASGVAEHSRVLQARQQMASLFPSTPGETMDEMRTRLAGMYSYAMAHGDEETMKDVGSTLRGIMSAPKQPSAMQHVPGVGLVDVSDPHHPQIVMPSQEHANHINAQEGVFEQKPDGLYDVATGKKWTGGTIHPVPLAPSFQAKDVAGPDGSPVVRPFNTKTGTMGAPVAQGKSTNKAMTAQNMATEALLRSSVSEMNKSDAAMRTYEADLSSGKVSINGLSQFMGGVGNSFTHDDPASRAIQNSALTVLNHTNPDLARYIRRGLSFAEGESGISKRPSDFRTKMATFLSTAASGANPAMIGDIQSRRSSILDPLNSIMTANPVGGSPSKGSGSATGTPSYDDWKAQHGH